MAGRLTHIECLRKSKANPSAGPCGGKHDLLLSNTEWDKAVGLQNSSLCQLRLSYNFGPAWTAHSCSRMQQQLRAMNADMLKPCCKHTHSRLFGLTPRRAFTHNSRRSRHSVVVHASLSNKGKQYAADLITVKKIIGEGSYGQVFEVRESVFVPVLAVN